jgi:putative cell wall-binding protein
MVDLYGTVVSRAKRATALVSLALVAALLVASPAAANHYTNTTELSATTNTGAAIAWSRVTFPTAAAEVLLGRDDVFADSLASGSMQTSRPLLLTNSQTLTPETDAELSRLKPSVVNILGGPSAVSTGIENDLRSRGYDVRRFSGPTRLETAIDVARRNYQTATSGIIASAFAPPNSDPTRAFADSIAAGGWAAASGLPVLLTETDHLSTSTRNYLRGSLIRSVFIVGGEGAVSSTTEAELRQIGITVTRVAGATRFDTAVAIAKQRGFADAAKATEVILTEGQAADAWASGFAAAAYAKAKGAPIVLSNNAMLPDPTKTYLAPAGGAAGTKLVCGPRVQSGPCDAATTAMGHTAVTGSLPRLTAVTLGASTIPGETELHYKFSEPVNTTVSAERFKLYTFDDLAVFPLSAVRDTNRPDVVIVRVPSAAYSESTVATVAYDAVRSAASGAQSMEGSVPLQAVNRTTAARGPNLTSIAVDDGDNEVTYTFDKAVTNCGDSDGYLVVFKTPDSTNTTVAKTTANDVEPVSGSPTKCLAEFPAFDTSTTPIARGFVEAGTVEAIGLGGATFDNPPTSADVRDSDAPDLTGFSVNAGSAQVVFTFDTDLDAVTATSGSDRNFKVYDSLGFVYGAASATLITDGSTSTQTRQVAATFDAPGVLRNAIVGAFVEAGGVKSRPTVVTAPPSTTPGRLNAEDEIRRTIGFEAGKTTGPVLNTVTRGNTPGNAGARITYTFADVVDESSTAGFFVYNEDGTRTALTAGECNVDASDQKKVVCDVPTNAATHAAVRAAHFGGIARDAVRADGQGSQTGNVAPNPEAGKAITAAT